VKTVHVEPARREYFVVHHSGASASQSVRGIQDWCMGDPTTDPPQGRGFSDIDYNLLVRGTTGEIYMGRGWDVVGSHVANFNTPAYGVCIIGEDQASPAAMNAVRWLYEQANARSKKKLQLLGHRDLATTGTDCPGDHVYAWVHRGMPAPATEDDTMDQATIKALAKAIVDEFLGRDLGHPGGGDTPGRVLQASLTSNEKIIALLERIADGLPAQQP
jgi:hypothetical protein